MLCGRLAFLYALTLGQLVSRPPAPVAYRRRVTRNNASALWSVLLLLKIRFVEQGQGEESRKGGLQPIAEFVDSAQYIEGYAQYVTALKKPTKNAFLCLRRAEVSPPYDG